MRCSSSSNSLLASKIFLSGKAGLQLDWQIRDLELWEGKFKLPKPMCMATKQLYKIPAISQVHTIQISHGDSNHTGHKSLGKKSVLGIYVRAAGLLEGGVHPRFDPFLVDECAVDASGVVQVRHSGISSELYNGMQTGN